MERQWWGTTIKAADDYSVLAVGSGANLQRIHKAVGSGGVFANSGGHALGLAVSDPASGFNLTVGYFGEMPYVAGQAVNPHQKLTVTLSGFLKPATYGDWVVGRNAELAVTSGSEGRGLFDFLNPHVFADSFGEAAGIFSFTTAADLSAAGLIGMAIHSNSGQVALQAGGLADGVLIAGAASGQTAWAKYMGRALVRAGGVVVKGRSITPQDSGSWIAAVSGGNAFARALQASAAGNSGGLFEAMLALNAPTFVAVESDAITG